MRFLWYFRLSQFLLIGSGFFALLVTEDYGLIAGIVFTLILIAGWNIEAGRWRLTLASIWWNLITIAAMFVCTADGVMLRQSRSIALLNFLIFLQTTKILRPKQHRDYVIIYVISFFELLASSILTMSMLFAISCIFFAITATWALITLYMKKEIDTYVVHTPQRGQSDQEVYNLPALNSLLTPKFFGGTLGVTLLTFLLALAIFVVLPRVREGFFFRYGADLSQRVSGFSDEVALDTFGTIRLDHRPVMQVFLPEGVDPNTLPTRLYWKGIAFNYYDGTGWRADPVRRKHITVQSQYEKLYWFNWQPTTKDLLAQRIQLSSTRFEVVFGADAMQAVEGKFLNLQYDRETGNTTVIFDPYTPEYIVYSKIAAPAETALRQDSGVYPDTIARLYLQLPELGARIIELAHQIGGSQASAYDKALAIQTFLGQNYAYSLDVKRTSKVSPLEDFLFINKAGHCEYYATSMAILLRVVGVPARVVNGFAQGRWNEFGRFFTVRQSDAHSWVEVYFPSAGWVMFDPTPGAAFGETYQQFAEQRSFLASLYRYSEYLRTSWNRYIVDYSREDQAQALVNAFIKSRSARYTLRNWLSATKDRIQTILSRISWRRIGSGLVYLSFGGFTLFWLWRLIKDVRLSLPGFRSRKRMTTRRVIQFYQTMLRVLARRGITKARSATPGEFAGYVAQHHALYGAEVRDLTNLYYAVRYGAMELSRDDVLRIEQLLQRLKKRPHPHKPAQG